LSAAVRGRPGGGRPAAEPERARRDRRAARLSALPPRATTPRASAKTQETCTGTAHSSSLHGTGCAVCSTATSCGPEGVRCGVRQPPGSSARSAAFDSAARSMVGRRSSTTSSARSGARVQLLGSARRARWRSRTGRATGMPSLQARSSGRSGRHPTRAPRVRLCRLKREWSAAGRAM
jgi:hypothetical protein